MLAVGIDISKSKSVAAILNQDGSMHTSVFGKSKCEQKGLQKVSTFSTRFYDVSKAFLGTKCSLLSTREDGAFCKSGCPGGQMLTSVPKGPLH